MDRCFNYFVPDQKVANIMVYKKNRTQIPMAENWIFRLYFRSSQRSSVVHLLAQLKQTECPWRLRVYGQKTSHVFQPNLLLWYGKVPERLVILIECNAGTNQRFLHFPNGTTASANQNFRPVDHHNRSYAWYSRRFFPAMGQYTVHFC